MKKLLLMGVLIASLNSGAQISIAPLTGLNGHWLIGVEVSGEYKGRYLEGSFISDVTKKLLLQTKIGWNFRHIIIYSGASYHLYATEGSELAWKNSWNVLFGAKYRYYISYNSYIAPEIQRDGEFTNYLFSVGYTIKGNIHKTHKKYRNERTI